MILILICNSRRERSINSENKHMNVTGTVATNMKVFSVLSQSNTFPLKFHLQPKWDRAANAAIPGRFTKSCGTKKATGRQGELADTLGSACTHKQTSSGNDRFAFLGQVSEQEGNGAGGTEKLALLERAALHASWHCQPAAPSFTLQCVPW